LEEIASELDVQGWLSKPWEPSVLRRWVRRMLQRDGPVLKAAA
jgi:hypothetical protein